MLGYVGALAAESARGRRLGLGGGERRGDRLLASYGRERNGTNVGVDGLLGEAVDHWRFDSVGFGGRWRGGLRDEAVEGELFALRGVTSGRSHTRR